MDDWAHLPGRLFVVSGPSGVGKSTLTRRLVEHPGIRARLSISATTRAPRLGEKEGIDYFFMTRDAFEQARRRGEFLEWAEVHGHLYGTPAGPVRDMLAQGVNAILVIDVQGGLQVKKSVPNAVLIFVHPPTREELEARLRSRGTDDDTTIERRLRNATRETELANQSYAYDVINDDIDGAVEALVRIMKDVEAERPCSTN